jgi:predicted nuclease of predicted toxin-antitoxin system
VKKSKRPSGASSSAAAQQPELTFFFRSLGGKVVAQTLRQQGEKVIVHDDVFPQDAFDEIWLTQAGTEGWVVLSKDRRIRYRANEHAALKAAKVRAFVLTGGNMPGEAMAQAFVEALPRMKELAATRTPPFLATVSAGGRVALLW